MRITRRGVLLAGGAAALVAGGIAAAKWRDLRRIAFVAGLADGSDHVDAFRSMDRIFPVRWFRRAGPVSDLPAGPEMGLPATFSSLGQAVDTEDFLTRTATTGLLVAVRDKVVLERYWRGNGPDTRWISWSVGKSFVSMLVGIALDQGAIASLDDATARYAPAFAGTAYGDVSIRDLLTMSSGVRWDENYADPESDIARFGRTLASGASMVDFARTLVRAHPPGTVMHYNTMDAQVLGSVLKGATGRTPSELLETWVWSRIGAEQDGYWILDGAGDELAGGGVNVTLRDYARFGHLYLHQGTWNGQTIVPPAWVRASHDPDAPRLRPPPRTVADPGLGYGYLWWVPGTVDGPYMAIGIFNQFVYVDPARQVVIAKTSASPDYMSGADDRVWREGVTLDLFTALAEAAATA